MRTINGKREIYIADTQNNAIRKITEDGVKSSMYCELIKADSTQQFIPVTIVAKTRQYHGETLIDCLFLQE